MILAIDPGTRRIGVAIADLETRIARPLEVIDVSVADPIERLRELIAEREVTQLVVGRPVNLSGHDGLAVEAQKGLLDALRSGLDVEIEVYDERLTTVIAERQMRTAGASAATRKEMRDAVAASVLLQNYMDSKR